MTIAPEAADQMIDQIYFSMCGKSKSSLRLWGIEMILCVPFGCCMRRVIGFCLENRPKDGDVVQCSENCDRIGFGGKLVFDGSNKTWKFDERPNAA
jgi:hypothetical protein